ncbi:MAG: amidohydrolase family protein [Saprospiraceae bacterium]|nr:amidohydrolase family protein [Saprospiraceae bacterium]
MKYTYILSLLLLSTFCYGQQVQKPQNGIFLLKNGKIQTFDQGQIEADVLIMEGRIKEIHNDISHPGAQVIDCTNHIIYPGMIDGGTRLGLSEVGSISLTQDHGEIGSYAPHLDALTAINPSSVNIPVTRVNGVTTSLAVPSRGRFPGTAALIDLHGYTPEQMYAGFKGVVLNFPSTGRRGSWDRRSDEDIQKADKKAKKELNDFWKQAELRQGILAHPDADAADYNPQLDALVDVLNKDRTLMLEVNRKSDILNALSWIRDKDINVIFTGVSEGYLVTDSLTHYNIDVITGPVLSNPGRSSDRYDVAYANAAVMQKAGIKVALRTNESENVRNLPFNAGFAATYGMGYIEALKAVTINSAEIFGIDKDYGSVETGKIANLFVADGDPFETKTKIKYLFIKGWNIPMESRHTLLYDEYLKRSPGIE